MSEQLLLPQQSPASSHALYMNITLQHQTLLPYQAALNGLTGAMSVLCADHSSRGKIQARFS